ncbi:GCN5-related N-acetyltransferase [Sesbania bispinosa]|nr:GCN5-related N-acetyltransferase [Sesbania bispinosa]
MTWITPSQVCTSYEREKGRKRELLQRHSCQDALEKLSIGPWYRANVNGTEPWTLVHLGVKATIAPQNNSINYQTN